jgi:hypothetical protein
MFRVIQRGSEYFVVQGEDVTRAGPYDALRPAQVAAAWLDLRKASRAVAICARDDRISRPPLQSAA